MAGPDRGQCKSCGAEVVWIKSTSGQTMICETRKRTIATPNGEVVSGHESHWGYCPTAKRHREESAAKRRQMGVDK